MSVAVIAPWGGDCPHRRAAWKWVRQWYAAHHPDWEVIRGECRSDVWCKAEAVADGLSRTKADILVIADADVVADEIGQTVRQIENGVKRWAVPHLRVHRLSRKATGRLLEGRTPREVAHDMDDYDQSPYRGVLGGGAVVLPREIYEDVPLDPGFRGWGQEDQSWGIALKAVHGNPWRSANGPLWHLWHPPQQRMTREKGSHESWRLYRAYCKVAASRPSAHRLVSPGRDLLASYPAGDGGDPG